MILTCKAALYWISPLVHLAQIFDLPLETLRGKLNLPDLRRTGFPGRICCLPSPPTMSTFTWNFQMAFCPNYSLPISPSSQQCFPNLFCSDVSWKSSLKLMLLALPYAEGTMCIFMGWIELLIPTIGVPKVIAHAHFIHLEKKNITKTINE